MTKKFDIIIIGASLAGCSAAATVMALHPDAEVLLLDKADFPRPKACGEGLSATGAKDLNKIFGDNFLSAISHVPIFGFQLKSENKISTVTAGTNSDQPVAYGVRRQVLDNACLKQLKGAAIRLAEGVQRVNFNSKDNSATVTTSKNTYAASVVIIADGARSKVSTLLKLPTQYKLEDRYGMNFQVSEVSVPEFPLINIVIKKRFEIYGTWVNKDQLNVAILGPRKIIGDIFKNGNLKSLSSEVSGPQQSSGSCGQSLVTGPLGTRRFHNDDLPFLLCGDAAESFDPLGGMGMSHALVSGGLAAKAAIKILAQGNRKKIIADYEKQRDIAARQHRGFTRLARANMQQLLPSRFIPAPALGLLGSWVESGLGNSDSLAGRLISLVGR